MFKIGAFTPSDWPYIPQLLQVHSLDFSHAFRPSVDKATEHLQLVQDALYAWQKDRQRKLSSSEGIAAALEEAETSSGNINSECYFYNYFLF